MLSNCPSKLAIDGDLDGVFDGDILGYLEGNNDGISVGEMVWVVCEIVGTFVGSCEGEIDGIFVGLNDGILVGVILEWVCVGVILCVFVGWIVCDVGVCDSDTVDCMDGVWDGVFEGDIVGYFDGNNVV